MSDEKLIDHRGTLYERSLTGEWKPKQGALGPVKDRDWFGNPKVARTIFGDPQEARGLLGDPIRSGDGAQLYHPRPSGSSGSGGEALAAIVGLLLIGLFIAVATSIALAARGLYGTGAALVRTWRGLVNTHPRAMLTTHLLLGMCLTSATLWIAGFPTAVNAAGAVAVPALWGWLWLTRRVPLVLMPVNAAIAGGSLWWLLTVSHATWAPVWLELTAGLPLIGRLPLIGAAAPLALWFWAIGMRRWPDRLAIPNLILCGAALWFLSMRVWVGWLPHWEAVFAPLPLVAASAGLFALIAPLLVWGWRTGMERWPRYLLVLNVVALGGMLALTAWHSQPVWQSTWGYWTGGLPGSGYPILVIGVSPIVAWGWSRAARSRPDLFVVPNLIALGAIACLITTRTREMWTPLWLEVRGQLALTPDPALIALVLPVAYWSWGYGRDRWPALWDAARATLLGVGAWWFVERSRDVWHIGWLEFAGPRAIDLALLALVAPAVAYGWLHLRSRQPRWMFVAGWVAGTLALAWIASRVFAEAGTLVVITFALIPLGAWGWSRFVRCYPRLGWALTLTPLVILAILAVVAPDAARAIADSATGWLVIQGVRFS